MKKLLLLLLTLIVGVGSSWGQTTINMATLIDGADAGLKTANQVSTTSGIVYSFSSGTYIGGIDNSEITSAIEGNKFITVAAWIWGNSSSGCIFSYGDQDDGIKFYINGNSMKITAKGEPDYTAKNATLQENAWNLVAFAFPGNGVAAGNRKPRYSWTATDGQYSTLGATDKLIHTPAAGGKKYAIGSGNQGAAREEFSGYIGNVVVILSDGLLENSTIAAQTSAPVFAPRTITENQTTALAPSPEHTIYSGGAGTSSASVSINHIGGFITLQGTTPYYLAESNSATKTEVNFSGATIQYSDAMGIGKATYNIDNTQITTPKFITSQGQNNRSAVVNLTGTSKITITGSTNGNNNSSTIMIGHWNGSSAVTLSNTASIEAANAQLLVGLTRNTQTITLNDNSKIKAKGIIASTNATGTNTLNINGGSLELGDVGITSYGNPTINVNVTVDATITATASTLPISQPITVAAGKTLTVNGAGGTVALTSAISGDGTVVVKNATLNLGSVRDLNTLGYSIESTCQLKFVETSENYGKGSLTITNIPSGITTVALTKIDGSTENLTVTAGTATFSRVGVQIADKAAWLDYTFDAASLAAHKPATAIGTITSTGYDTSTMTIDNNLKSDVAYDAVTGNLLAKTTPYRSISWPGNYSVAVYSNVPDVEDCCLMAFGASTQNQNWLALVRGTSSNEIKLVKGAGTNAYENVTVMVAPNATTKKHLVVFTKEGDNFKVYLDGVEVAATTYSSSLGSGFQIGSIHGGVTNTGVSRISEQSNEIKDAVKVGAIRVYDYILSSEQMQALSTAFPFVSASDTYTRTISSSTEDLSSSDSWTMGGSTYGLPQVKTEGGQTYDPSAVITTSVSSTLNVNANVTFEKMTFDGTAALKISSTTGNKIAVTSAITINSPITIEYGTMDIAGLPLSLGASGTLTFDFSNYDFRANFTSRIQLTGVMSRADDKVSVISKDGYTLDCVYDASSQTYWLNVTDNRDATTVYLPSGVADINISMPVRTSLDKVNPDTQLKADDTLEITAAGTYTLNGTLAGLVINSTGDEPVKFTKGTGEYIFEGQMIEVKQGDLRLTETSNGNAKVKNAYITLQEGGDLTLYGWPYIFGTLSVMSDYDKVILDNVGNNKATLRKGEDGSTLYISEKVTVDANVDAGLTLSGTGTVKLSGFPTTADAPVLSAFWAGKVIFPAKSGDVGDFSALLNAWGNASSKIVLNNVGTEGSKGQGQGTYFNGSVTVNPKVEINAGATVILNNGNGGTTGVFTELSGAGTLRLDWTANSYTQKINSLTNFTGILNANSTRSAIIVDVLALDAEADISTVGTKLISTNGNVTLTGVTKGGTPVADVLWMRYEDGIYTYVEEDNRTTAKGKFGTVCLPYDAVANGADLYTATVEADKVVLTQVSGNEMVAGKPYIYYSTADGGSQTFSKKSGGATVASPVNGSDGLMGTFVPMTAIADTYVLQTISGVQKFRQVETGREPTVGAYRCYVVAPAGDTAREMSIVLGGDATSIDMLNAVIDNDAVIYDLNGRKQDGLRKGLQIVNGVKVLVK